MSARVGVARQHPSAPLFHTFRERGRGIGDAFMLRRENALLRPHRHTHSTCTPPFTVKQDKCIRSAAFVKAGGGEGPFPGEQVLGKPFI